MTLDGADLFGRERLVLHEVEARLLVVDQRAALLHVFAQHFAQGLVHQVGHRMVARDRRAARAVHPRFDRVAHLERARLERAMVAEDVGLDFLRVGHFEGTGSGHQLALVAHLAAGLGVERGAVEHHDAGLAAGQFAHRGAVPVERRHPGAIDAQYLVALEFGLAAIVRHSRRRLELGRGARALALLVHRRFVAGDVDGLAPLPRDVGGEVDRKAEGIVEREHGFAVDHVALAPEGDIEDFHPVLERFGEALLLGQQGLLDPPGVGREFGIGRAHRRHQVRHDAVEKRLALAQLVAVAQGAADDPAQHVAAAVVGGNHPVDDQERAGADVVGDHLERGVGQIPGAGLARRRLDQVDEQVDLVVAVHMLQHRGDALQAHAGVDAGLGQARHGAVRLAVELHEHQVPDFDIAVAVGIGGAGRAAGDFRAVVVEDLGTRTAGAGVGHLPEIVGGVLGALVVADAHDALCGHADFLGPDVVGLVVVDVDRDPQLILGQLVDPGEQFPGVMNRLALEVVAEGKIAQHFEKRVVPRRIADVFQVVVLAAGAHAALRRGGARIGARLLADEHVLELHHARIGEQQGRVVAGHQGARGHPSVALELEVGKKLFADFRGVHWSFFKQNQSFGL